MKHPQDPIAYAWAQLHRIPLPASLASTAIQRAGHANGALGKKGRGKHILAVCV